jgi:hypothetical protein
MDFENECSNQPDEYIWNLDEKYAEKAKLELGETDSVRSEALKQMRQWIQNHPNIQECRMDSNFLLRFIRKVKFNIPKAQKLLENFLIAYQFYPERIQHLNSTEEKIKMMTESGITVLLPQRDDEGRQICLTRIENLDPSKYNSIDIIRLASIIMDIVESDEISQISGVIKIIDVRHLCLSHLTIFSLSEIRQHLQNFMIAFPVRLQGIYFMNLPWIAEKIVQIIKSMLKKKIGDRIITIHSNEELCSHINPKILPMEYGGQIPLTEIIQYTKEQMAQNTKGNLYKYDNFMKTNFECCNI